MNETGRDGSGASRSLSLQATSGVVVSIALFSPEAIRRQTLATQLEALGYRVHIVADAAAVAALPAHLILLTDAAEVLRPWLAVREPPTMFLVAGPLPACTNCTVLSLSPQPGAAELRIAIAAAVQLQLRDQRYLALQQAHAELAKAAENFRVALRHSPVILFNQDADLRYTWIYNPATDSAADALVGKSEKDLFTADDAARLRAFKRKVLRDGVTRSAEFTLGFPDGERSFELTVEALQAPTSGVISGITCTAIDISHRKRVEQALAASEQLFHTVFDEISDGVGLYDVRRGRIVAANRSAADMFGYAPAEFLKLGVAQISDDQPPYAEADALARLGQALASGQQELVEWRVRHRSGRRLWVEFSLRRVSIKGEDLLLVLGRDITASKAALAALRDREERLREFFAHAPIGLMTVGLDFRLVDVNDTLCRLLGYSAEELKAMRFTDVTHPDDRAADMQSASDMLAGRLSHVTVEKRYQHKDGHPVWVRVTRAVMRDDDGKIRYGIGLVEDISEKHEAERLRIEHLEHQRDVLVREVHHRIKNNLQGVISLIEQLKRKQPGAAEALEEAASQIGAIAVVHGLHSKTLVSEVRPRQLVRAIVDAVTHLMDTPIDYRENDDDPDCEWHINSRDIVAVALIINELLYNAVKHSGQDGGIEVSLGGRGVSFSMRVRNWPATLPTGFDFAAGVGLGTGLTLISSLLPRQGAHLLIRQRDNAVEAKLELTHPCADALAAGENERERLP